MRKYAQLSVAAIAWAVAASAHAAVIVTVTNLGPATDSSGEVAVGFTAFKLTASTNDGGKITAIDMGHSPGSPYAGITGSMLQEWDIGRSGESATPIENGQMLNSDYGLDSHWLFTGNSSTAAPVEDNSGVNPPGSPADTPGPGGEDFGMGTFLGGNQGIDPAQQASRIDFAYVVLTSPATAGFTIDIAELVGTTSSDSVDTSFMPEPASLGLLAFAGFALLARRGKA